MTDARLPDAWLGNPRFDLLSDEAWRVFTGALMWSARNGTDGWIPERYLRALHPDGEKRAAFAEICEAGVWRKEARADGAGYQLIGWADGLGQSTAEQVERYREKARLRQRRKRAKDRAEEAPVTRDVARDVGTARIGTDRHGTDQRENAGSRRELSSSERSVSPWPEEAFADGRPF